MNREVTKGVSHWPCLAGRGARLFTTKIGSAAVTITLFAAYRDGSTTSTTNESGSTFLFSRVPVTFAVTVKS
jgi:hypothetical protein